jgi:protein-S-isoprenylcysteine O-methyltransferase Ste14
MACWLAAVGRKIYNKRLYVGLAMVPVGLEVLVPAPFLGPGHLGEQVLGLIATATGLALRAWGAGCAGGHTRSAKIEGERLVTGGPFAYVRNPIYLGTMLLGFGMCALIGDPRAYPMAALVFMILYFAIIPAEEEHLAQQFGPAYEQYRTSVPRLIPRLQPWASREPSPFRWAAARGEAFIALVLAFIYAGICFEEYLDRLFPWA